MPDVRPYPKAQQLERSPAGIGMAKHSGQRRFRHVATAAEWAELRKAKLGPCLVCLWLKTPQRLPSSLHHAVSKSLGGSDCPSNLVAVCGGGTTGHHGRLEARDPETCRAFAAAVQQFDSAVYAYAVGRLGEDGFLRRYRVDFK